MKFKCSENDQYVQSVQGRFNVFKPLNNIASQKQTFTQSYAAN